MFEGGRGSRGYEFRIQGLSVSSSGYGIYHRPMRRVLSTYMRTVRLTAVGFRA